MREDLQPNRERARADPLKELYNLKSLGLCTKPRGTPHSSLHIPSADTVVYNIPSPVDLVPPGFTEYNGASSMGYSSA
jgi:hypothetical protein